MFDPQMEHRVRQDIDERIRRAGQRRIAVRVKAGRQGRRGRML
jgi:hypothetical protein